MIILSAKKLFLKKMERKEFLMYIGLFFLGISGITGLLKNITESVGRIAPENQQHPQSFGNGPYGGLQKGGK